MLDIARLESRPRPNAAARRTARAPSPAWKRVRRPRPRGLPSLPLRPKPTRRRNADPAPVPAVEDGAEARRHRPDLRRRRRGGPAHLELLRHGSLDRDGRVRVQVASVAPQVSGQVTELRIVDNQFVHRGDVLYVIDRFDFETALAMAKSTVRQRAADLQVKRVQAERRQHLSDLATTPEEQQQLFGQRRPGPGRLRDQHSPRRPRRRSTSSARR